jgi:hypothetical protein
MPAMTDLLQFAIEAHGGEANWATVRSIVVSFNFNGALREIKGFPGHRRPMVSIDARNPRTVIQHLERVMIGEYSPPIAFGSRTRTAGSSRSAQIRGRRLPATW